LGRYDSISRGTKLPYAHSTSISDAESDSAHSHNESETPFLDAPLGIDGVLDLSESPTALKADSAGNLGIRRYWVATASAMALPTADTDEPPDGKHGAQDRTDPSEPLEVYRA
jgi:hypothetical protein